MLQLVTHTVFFITVIDLAEAKPTLAHNATTKQMKHNILREGDPPEPSGGQGDPPEPSGPPPHGMEGYDELTLPEGMSQDEAMSILAGQNGPGGDSGLVPFAGFNFKGLNFRELKRYQESAKKAIVRKRTTPKLLSFLNDCDYTVYYCQRTYQTGTLCGRTSFNHYFTFGSYCMLDYVNCMERWDKWELAYMGICNYDAHGLNVRPFAEYKHYPYENDYFLDQYYPIEYGHGNN